MILYRQSDPRFPFLWETAGQPAGRWHAAGEGPVQYLADTPDGAWAEFLRHEGIGSDAEAMNVRRTLWAVEVESATAPERPRLPAEVLQGGLESFPACRQEARRLRARGASALAAPAAALREARGWRVEGGLRSAPDREATLYAFFGRHPGWTGWRCGEAGAPPPGLAPRVAPL